MIKNTLRPVLASVALVFGFVSISLAQAQAVNFHEENFSAGAATTTGKADFSHVKIGNFGQMDERFLRGAQPLQDDYQALKDLGVNTVIDLRKDPTDYEKAAVEALGMTHV